MAKPRPHIPTAKTLSQVRMGAMLGIPPHDIAKLLGITKGQLLKHYATELATGPARADKAVRVDLLIQVTNAGPSAVAAPKAWLDRQQTNSSPQRAESLIKQTEFAPAKSEKARVGLFQLRLAKERGERISRDAQLEVCKTAGRMVARAIMATPMWTEEVVGIYRTGGDSALRQWLRAKAVETFDSLVDLMTAPDGSL